MIAKTLYSIIGTACDMSGPGWNSRRLLLASDGMGFSLTDTIVEKGAELELEYTHHFEACYCIQGSGEITQVSAPHWHPLIPYTLYALDQNDRHVVRATDDDMRLVCVFNPPLNGNETHGPDGSYAASGS